MKRKNKNKIESIIHNSDKCDPYWKKIKSVDKEKNVIWRLKQIWLDQNMTHIQETYSILLGFSRDK